VAKWFIKLDKPFSDPSERPERREMVDGWERGFRTPEITNKNKFKLLTSPRRPGMRLYEHRARKRMDQP